MFLVFYNKNTGVLESFCYKNNINVDQQSAEDLYNDYLKGHNTNSSVISYLEIEFNEDIMKRYWAYKVNFTTNTVEEDFNFVPPPLPPEAQQA
jgi:hypothetical protein